MERERERRKGLEDDPFETKKRLPIIPACTDVKPGQIEEREASVKACTSSFSFSPGFKFVWRTLDFWVARERPCFSSPFLSLSRLNELKKKKRENVDDIVDVRSSFVESFEKKGIRSKIDWDLDKERKIKISIQGIPFFPLSSFSFIMRRQKLIIPELNSNGWGIG